jgi:hypothetical protein
LKTVEHEQEREGKEKKKRKQKVVRQLLQIIVEMLFPSKTKRREEAKAG